MKTVQKVILSTGLLLAPIALVAKTAEQAYVESYRGRSDLPVPVSVVKPSVPRGYAGQSVVLEFVVDATGTPRDIRLRDGESVAPDLSGPVIAAVAQWKFQPLVRDGVAVTSKVVLPVRVVESIDTRGMLATR